MATPFEVLADQTRRRILDYLRREPRTVNELAELLEISQPGVSKQLRVLRDAGLVRVRQEAQRRWYEVDLAPLAEVDAWLEPYRRLMEERYERLDDLLDQLNAEEQPDDET